MKLIKLSIIVSFISINYANAQKIKAGDLLNWMIAKDHLDTLGIKTNIEPFFGTKDDVLLTEIIRNNLPSETSKRNMKDFMTPEEIKLFHKQLPYIKQHLWPKTPYKLKTFFFVSDAKSGKFQKVTTCHYLSLPIFLNKAKTRVILAESFTAGVAFGRGDLVLCEFKQSGWQEIVRAATVNE